MPRIVLADDHEVVRRGMRAILESQPGFEVAAEAADGVEAVEAVLAHRPDVAVLDFAMPRLSGLEAARRIGQGAPETAVLIFTMHDSEAFVRQALDAGVRGYVLKTDADLQLIAAVKALASRRTYLSSSFPEAVQTEFRDQKPRRARTGGPLTPRERQVVQLIAEGNSNKMVGSRLGLSVKTVETHRAAAMRKLDARSTADLVRYAVRNHLVVA